MEERYKVLLYNAIVLLEEFTDYDYNRNDLLIELGMTEAEYEEIMEEI